MLQHSSITSTTAMASSSVLQDRQRHVGPNVALSYAQPIHMVSGRGCYLYDEDQQRYLDCVNNVAHVGHANEAVAAAVSHQMTQLNTNSRYLSRGLTDYTAALAAKFAPSALQVVYMVNSGSEANDLALRMAQAVNPGADHVVVLSGAYHGHLSSLIPLSPYKFWGPGGGGKPDWVHVIPCPDTYRGLHLDGTAAAQAALAAAAAAGGRVAMFIAEAIPSCGGQMMLPPGYLAQVYAVMQAAGVVCVADEVQTGFGRVGDAFWAYQLHGVSPDVVTLGKPIGNGFPLGALVTTPRVAAAFCTGMEYFNTYGGCNAAVAAGSAVLQQIEALQLQQAAAVVGRHLKAGLEALQRDYPQVLGDVRGVGLFLGVEVVRDRHSQVPAPRIAAAIKEGAKARRVLLSCDGPFDNVIKIKPPMVFGVEEADLLLATLREVLLEVTSASRLAVLQAAEQQHYDQVLQQRMATYAANAVALLAHCPGGKPQTNSEQQQKQQQQQQSPLQGDECGQATPSLRKVLSGCSDASSSCSSHDVCRGGWSPVMSSSIGSEGMQGAVHALSQLSMGSAGSAHPKPAVTAGESQGCSDMSSSPVSQVSTLSSADH